MQAHAIAQLQESGLALMQAYNAYTHTRLELIERDTETQERIAASYQRILQSYAIRDQTRADS